MVIIYISNIGNDQAAGLFWSIPNSVAAQQKIDDCQWINLNKSTNQYWSKIAAFRTISDVNIDDFPCNLLQPYNKADLVVFEGFYNIQMTRMAAMLRKKEIPYIIVPRGSLTRQAFKNHNMWNYFKKKIAVALFFKKYTRNAAAIQFLTTQEKADSGNGWCKRSLVIPNGIDIPMHYKKEFSSNGILGIIISRASIKHKGLDILLAAVGKIAEEMRKANFIVRCYLPKKDDYIEFENIVKKSNVSDIIQIEQGVYEVEKRNAILKGDVFIMTSRFEGHPMGLIEALSYGLPAAVTIGSNMGKEINDCDAGWVAETDVDSVAAMFRKVISERGLLQCKGANARELAYKYSWDDIAKRFHSCIIADVI